MVPSGIKVKLQNFDVYILNLDFIHIGESNAGNPTYACKFARMIVRWRDIWNTRTNGITDIQFPFGFVQVSFTTVPPKNYMHL
jgi:hypothetical protein